MKEKINILIPSGHSPWTIPTINCLSFNSNYKLFLLSAKKHTAAKYSRYISYYKFHHKMNNDLDKIYIINQEVERHNISIIIPLEEEENIFFIKNSNKISSLAKIIPLSSLSSYETAINKWKLNGFLQQKNIPNPLSLNYPSKDFLKKVEDDFHFPVLIKPSNSEGGKGIVKFNTKSEFEAYFNGNIRDEFLLQEYVEGYDIDCSVLCLSGEILTHTIQRGSILANNPYAQQLAIEFLDNNEVYIIVKKLMLALDWSGVAHIDLRYNKNSDEYNVIEINGRFWGSMEASRMAGINFPNLICELALGKDVVHKEYEHIKYMRWKGFLKNLKNNFFSIFNFGLIINNTGAIAVLKDPMPSMFKIKEKLRFYFKS